MPTVEEILGKQEINVESILGTKPPLEELTPQMGIEGIDERYQYISDSVANITGERPSTTLSPYLRAIPPTLWELAKDNIPGVKLLSQEFLNTPWWLGRIGMGKELPPEFDNKEWTIEELEELQKRAIKEHPDKIAIIGEEVTSLLSFYLFPKALNMVAELVGPPVQRFAPTLYKILTKEIKLGRKAIKIPEEIKPIEVIPEIKPEMKLVEPQKIGLSYINKLSEEELRQVADRWEIKWSKDANYMRGKIIKELNKISVEPEIKPELKVEAKPELKPEIPIEERRPTFDELIKESEANNLKIEEIHQRFLGGEGPFESTVKYDPHQAMAEAGTESMVEKGIKRDPKKLMTEQLIDEWLADPSKYENIMNKYGMTPKEWAGIMREQASSWGRKLGELGLEAQRLGKDIPEIGEALTELERMARMPSVWDRIQNGWKNIDRVRRGLLVTQLSTAMRNGFSQAGRVSMDIPEKAMNYYLAKLFGMSPKGSPLDGVEQLLKVVQRGESQRIAKTVLEAFPKQYSRMYSTYMSDIEIGKIGQNISKGVDILNTANRFQEFLFRNGVFSASLEQELRSQGMDLIKIIESGTLKEIPREMIEKSVGKALEMTFAETPKYGTIGKKFVDFVTSMPGATFILPFPRFMINSLKFNFEYSPLGLLKLLSPAERAAFAAGDVHVMSRAIMGSAMLGIAWQIRNSEFAGEKWNEIKVGDKTINMMPYNPFIVYLFAADIIKKANEGTLYKLTAKDVSMGVLSSNMRAGVGLYALDEVINGLSKTGDPQKAADVLKTFGGETIAGLLTPLNQVKELLSGFDDYIVKEKRTEPFMGPIKEKIPEIEKTLPVLYSPTREGPVTRELPILRQTTGAMIGTKNTFEKELDRLGFSYQEIFHSTGDPEADNSVKKYMGIMASQMAIPLIESQEYQSLTEGQRALVLANLLNEIRSTAKQAAEEENPNLFTRLKLERIPKRERIVMEEQGIDIKELQKQLTQ